MEDGQTLRNQGSEYYQRCPSSTCAFLGCLGRPDSLESCLGFPKSSLRGCQRYPLSWAAPEAWKAAWTSLKSFLKTSQIGLQNAVGWVAGKSGWSFESLGQFQNLKMLKSRPDLGEGGWEEVRKVPQTHKSPNKWIF